MDYLESVAKAIADIEDRLTHGVTADEVAQRAGYSPFHFNRIFQTVTRSSVADYIRRRRLTLAAYEVFAAKTRIIEIAFKYGFESQEAFTRSFRSMFSMTPGQFRSQTHMGNTLFRAMGKHALDDAGLRHLLYGVTHEPAIVTLERIHAAGMVIAGIDPLEIARLWGRFRQRAAEAFGEKEQDRDFYALIELTGVQWEAAYTACAAVHEEEELPEGMVRKTIPSGTYAVFTHRGPLSKIPDTFHYIYAMWLPKSGRRRRNVPEFARYGRGYRGPADGDSAFEIYIPVTPGEPTEGGS